MRGWHQWSNVECLSYSEATLDQSTLKPSTKALLIFIFCYFFVPWSMRDWARKESPVNKTRYTAKAGNQRKLTFFATKLQGSTRNRGAPKPYKTSRDMWSWNPNADIPVAVLLTFRTSCEALMSESNHARNPGSNVGRCVTSDSISDAGKACWIARWFSWFTSARKARLSRSCGSCGVDTSRDGLWGTSAGVIGARVGEILRGLAKGSWGTGIAPAGWGGGDWWCSVEEGDLNIRFCKTNMKQTSKVQMAHKQWRETSTPKSEHLK